MNTFFAHHSTMHNSGNRALFLATLAVLAVILVGVAIVKRGGHK